MACLFNGTTSKVEHTTADLDLQATGQVTILAWAYATGQGESSLGRIIQLSEVNSTGYALFHNNANNTLRFIPNWNPTSGDWTFPANDNQWNAIAVTYDINSSANVPLVRVNFAPATLTTLATPSGTAATIQTGYCVGNVSDSSRTWAGRLGVIQVYNSILTPDQCDAELLRPGTTEIRPKLWLPMWGPNELEDLSGNRYHGTGTALTNQPNPPIAVSWGGYDESSFTVVAAGNQNVNLTSIGSAEAFGTPTFTVGNVNVNLTGIASSEVFGTPTFTVGNVNVNLTGIASAEAFGTITFTSGGVNVNLTGIASAEAFGSPTFTLGNVDINLTGIASAEAFGVPTFTIGNANINLTGIPSSEAFGSVTFIGGAVIEPLPETTPWTSVQTVFGALIERGQATNLNIAVGSLEELTDFPYVSLTKLSTSLNVLTSCLSRFEESAYQFVIYDYSLDKTLKHLKTLKRVYDYSTFRRTNRKFASMQWNQESVQESEPGLFEGRLFLEILTEKPFSRQYNKTDKTAGETIAACIYNRFNEYKSDVFTDVDFFSSRFAAERSQRPYIVLPDLQSREEQINSKGRHEQTTFTFNSYGSGCFETEMLNERLMYVFDYCKLELPDLRYTGLEWVSDEIAEEEPGIWRGAVTYNLLLENSIT